MQRSHFTATVYIFDAAKSLLIYHKKIKKWLPPGGHLKAGERPDLAAIREAKEETGIDVELIVDDNIKIDAPNAVSFPRPYLCLYESIKSHEKEKAHHHMDMIYVARAVGGIEKANFNEIDEMRWFTQAEIEALISEEEIYHETKITLRKLFKEEIYVQ